MQVSVFQNNLISPWVWSVSNFMSTQRKLQWVILFKEWCIPEDLLKYLSYIYKYQLAINISPFLWILLLLWSGKVNEFQKLGVLTLQFCSFHQQKIQGSGIHIVGSSAIFSWTFISIFTFQDPNGMDLLHTAYSFSMKSYTQQAPINVRNNWIIYTLSWNMLKDSADIYLSLFVKKKRKWNIQKHIQIRYCFHILEKLLW